jgi:hypothetical protein
MPWMGNPKKLYFSKTSPSVEAINRGIDVSVAKIRRLIKKGKKKLKFISWVIFLKIGLIFDK